jgi:hypothetical protein
VRRRASGRLLCGGGGIRDAMQDLLSISSKLEDGPFKDQVVREMREYMLDLQFVGKLDSLPHLIGFDNGVWDLDAGVFREATPEDLICKSVGYSYTEHDSPGAEAVVREYWDVMPSGGCFYITHDREREKYTIQGIDARVTNMKRQKTTGKKW